MMAMEEGGGEEKASKEGEEGKDFKVPPIFWAVIPLLPSSSSRCGGGVLSLSFERIVRNSPMEIRTLSSSFAVPSDLSPG